MFVRVGGLRLELLGRPAGDGRILMLHAWGAHAGYYAAVLRALPQHLAAVALSLSGHGRSEAPPQPPAHVETWLREVEGTLAALGWPKAVLVGNSFGAGGALLFFASRRTSVRGLVLVGGTPGGRSPLTSVRTRRRTEALLAATRPPQNAALVARLLRRQLAGLPEASRLLELSLRTHPWSLEAAARFGWEVDLGPLLPTVDIPTAIFRGAEDPFLDPDREPLARIPGARTYVFPGEGHFPMVGSPVRFAATLVAFLEGAGLVPPGSLGPDLAPWALRPRPCPGEEAPSVTAATSGSGPRPRLRRAPRGSTGACCSR